MLEGKSDEALVSFDRAIALDAALDGARLNRGIALLRRGDAAGASRAFEELWKRETSALRAEAAYHNGIALDRLGRHTDAETWLTRAVALDPALDASLLYVSSLRERRGDYEGAARVALDYLKAHPDSTLAMLRVAKAAHRAGRRDVARSYFDKVIATSSPRSEEAIEARKFLVMFD